MPEDRAGVDIEIPRRFGTAAVVEFENLINVANAELLDRYELSDSQRKLVIETRSHLSAATACAELITAEPAGGSGE